MRLRDNNYFYHKVGGQEVIFEAANQDTSGSQYQYFGFLNADGSWLIQRFDIQGGATTYTYAAGQRVVDYLINWDETGLYVGSLTFKRFDQIKFG